MRLSPDQLTEIVHGTTVATYAVLEGKGARTGLLTTRGIRDVLELRREYERTSTTVINAYLKPVVRSYLQGVRDELSAAAVHAPLLIMQSNGEAAVATAIHSSGYRGGFWTTYWTKS